MNEDKEDTITINADSSLIDSMADTSNDWSNITISTGAAGSLGNYSIGAIGSSNTINIGAGNYTIPTSSYYSTTGWTTGSSDLDVKGDASFDGDIKWKGRSLGKLLEKIEDRLAILPDPDPAKLEKHAALKKAYDHYKILEKLIGED
jgi:hypothetical protein